MVDQSLLVSELTRFARLLVTDYPVSDALHDIVESAAEILGIHGAGMSLVRDGRLQFATASPQDIASLEQIQAEQQTGPCLDAYAKATPVLVDDLRTHRQRWPELVDVASSAGIAAVGAVPLLIDDAPLGTLDLYDTRPRTWTEEETEVASLLGVLAAGHFANTARLDRANRVVDQLQEALDSRVIIEQAKGILAGERGISVDDAFGVLRAHARHRGASLREIAHAVVHLGLRP